MDNQNRIDVLQIPLERDLFMRTLIGELAETLSDVIGTEEASGFISVVGQNMGTNINQDYKKALQVDSLSRQQVTAVLVDLKKRIKGDFYVIEADQHKIILGNRRCPFGDKVIGRPVMCMMTSNVFGVISAENLGYSKVAITESIAQGSAGCRVVVYLTPEAASDEVEGREYFQTR